MMLTKSSSNGIPQSAQKRKLDDKSKDIKNAKQRRLEKVMQHVRQSPRRSAKDSKSDPRDYLEPLTCGVCAATFSSKSRAKFCVHMKRDHFLEVHYQCQACLKTFPDQRLLQNHKCQVLTAADDKQSKMQHTCTLCQLVFSSLYDINLHRWSSHGAKAYRCLQCSRLLGSVANLADHVRDHSRRPRVSSNRRPFSSRHRRQKLLFNKQNKKTIKKNLDSAKTFQCDFCKHTFQNLSLTMEHRRGLHKEAKLTCNCCQLTFPDSTHLGQHLARGSDDAEMTDTAVSSSNKEEADTEKESPAEAAELPSSDTDVVPASSPATTSPATQDMGDFTTTDQDAGTPCKTDPKAEIPKEVSEAPSTVKTQSQFDTLSPVSKSPGCNTQNQCQACKSTFTPDTPESEQNICSKCEVISKTVTSKDEPPSPSTSELISEKPEQEVDEKEPADPLAKDDLSDASEAEEPEDPKSDEEEEDPSAESKDPKKNYMCDFCEQSFGSVTWVMRHRKKHEETQLKCNICQIKFLQSSDLGHHLAECRQEMSSSFYSTAPSSNNACTSTVPLPVEKTNGKSYACDFCSQSFASVSWVMRHRKQHVDDLGNYWCRVCFETFEKSSDFGRHLADCVGARKTPVPDGSRVVADKKETTAKKEANPEKKKEADKENGSSEPQRRFRCDFCSQKFASIRWVIRHRQQHTDECTCQICFLTFDRTVELGRHLAAGCALIDEKPEPSTKKPDSEVETSKPDSAEKESSHDLSLPPEPSQSSESKDDGVVYPCDFCLQSFASGRWVIRHRKQHEGGETLTCQRCQAMFNRSVDLSKHLSVCPKTQGISAVMCQSSLVTSEGAEEDGNERSFQCDICGQNYASARWVMRHRRSHNTSEFPYVCRNCKCSFNRSVEISQHLRSCHSSSALVNSVDQTSRTGPGNSENPNTSSVPNQSSDRSLLSDNSENSFLNDADLNVSNAQPLKPSNDGFLPVCVKVENFAATSTPINLSVRPDSAEKTNEISREAWREQSALDSVKKLDCLGKISPIDLVQRKKISIIPKKEIEERLADPIPDKTQYSNINNTESKPLPPKTPEGQFPVRQEPNIKPSGTGAKFPCDYCSDKFPDVITLLTHRRKHSLSSSCHRCGKKYTKCIEVCQHLERCHTNIQVSSSTSQIVPKQYYCDFCFKTYGGSNWIMRHRRKHTDEKDYTCRVCKFSTKGAGFMARHLASCQWIKANLIKNGFQPKKNVTNAFAFPPSSAITCDFCSAPFSSIPELVQHRKYHTPEELPWCQHCAMTLISHKQMANHLACCPANPNNQKFVPPNPNRNGIVKHEDFKMKYLPKEQGGRVDTEKVFTCDFCGQGFASCSMVMQHRRFHTKESSQVCRNCGKLFAISEMGIHLSICKQRPNSNPALPSTDSRPLPDGDAGVLDLKKTYTCDFCSKTFDTSNWIMRHRLIHTSNVPYKCYRCYQIFDMARSMADHLTTCHLSLSSTGQASKLLAPNSDKMTYLCDRCGGHFPRTEVTRATEAVTYRCHYCLKQKPVNSIMNRKIDGACAHCVAGFDSPASLQNHLKNCTANKQRNEFYSSQKAGTSRLDESGRRLSALPLAHSKILDPCYSEPQDLSINSLRTFTPSLVNRFSAASPRKSFTLEDQQNLPGGASLAETPKMYQEKIYITQGSFERTAGREPGTCTVPVKDFDKANSIWDGNGRNFENQSVSGMPTDLRVEDNGLNEPEKQNVIPKDQDSGELKIELNGKVHVKTELMLSEHPSSNTSSKNAKEMFTQSLNLISKKSKFPCDFCDAAFATDSLLLSHRLLHVDEPNLWCRLCRRAFSNSSDFVCHLTCCKIKHKNTNNMWPSPSLNKKEPYRCDFCDKSFTHRHAVMRHRQEHEQEEGIFRCRRCDCVFYTSSVFVGHLSVCMSSRISSMPSNRSRGTYWSSCGKNGYMGSWRRLVSTSREKTQKLYYCDFCHRRFGGSNWIMRHRRTHVDGCIYTCQLCGLIFKQAGLMADHLTQCYSPLSGRETPSQAKSSESESAASSPKIEEFSDRDSEKEEDEKKPLVLVPYQCKPCSCFFDTKEDLECHVSSCNKSQDSKTLPTIKDWQQKSEAKICFKMPISPAPAAKPVPASSKQTEFPCDFCGKCFLGVSWILRHRRTHVADPTNLKCQHCRRDFENSSSFVSHLNSCLKPADYSAVQKAFLSKSSPAAIIKQESESGSSGSSEVEDNTPVSFTFECCSQTFSQVTDLTAHIKTHSRRPST